MSGGVLVVECGKFVLSYMWGLVCIVDLLIGIE